MARSANEEKKKKTGIRGRVAIADEQRADLHQWLNCGTPRVLSLSASFLMIRDTLCIVSLAFHRKGYSLPVLLWTQSF